MSGRYGGNIRAPGPKAPWAIPILRQAQVIPHCATCKTSFAHLCKCSNPVSSGKTRLQID